MNKAFFAAAMAGVLAANANAQIVVESDNAADRCVLEKAKALFHGQDRPVAVEGPEFSLMVDDCSSRTGITPNIFTKEKGGILFSPLYRPFKPWS